jgi:hypothetical protein
MVAKMILSNVICTQQVTAGQEPAAKNITEKHCNFVKT